MARKIDYDSIHEALIAAVQDRGADWKYPSAVIEQDDEGYDVTVDRWHDNEGSCVFALDDGTPACIVGYALDYLGYPVATIPNGGASGAVQYVTGDADSGALDPEYVWGGPMWPLMEALNAAQARQDVGQPWGKALDGFEEAYAKYEAAWKEKGNR